ncbi:hypothetical protein [Paenibacillus xylanilyticus]|uniref:Uncharacterized protein n=1 Tax=Paenibacillus xylanilyticus TaxID=248903 RepID=A0A7Y6BZ78_9BACL|nr:hypothetical protein [Paenibacillus xylanilyticus]NUU77653.1 hypothetical protein [Paenibacillus xylanilyticus]
MKFLFELMLSMLMLTNGSSGDPLTREDIQSYLKTHHLQYADAKIVNDRSALLVDVKGEHAKASVLTKSADNKLVMQPNEYVWEEDMEGISVERVGRYLCVVIHDKARSHDMDFVNIVYVDDNGDERKDRYYFNGKQAIIIPMPTRKESVVVAIYGNDGFIHDMVKRFPEIVLQQNHL